MKRQLIAHPPYQAHNLTPNNLLVQDLYNPIDSHGLNTFAKSLSHHY